MVKSGKFFLPMNLNTTLIPLLATINLRNYHLEFQVSEKYSRMSVVLEGLDGAVRHTDDVLIFPSSKDKTWFMTVSYVLSNSLRRQASSSTPSYVYSPLIMSSFLIILLTRLGYKQTQLRHLLFFRWMLPLNLSGLGQFLGMANQFGQFSLWSANH